MVGWHHQLDGGWHHQLDGGWHHQINGHESEQVPGDVEGQRILECFSPWGHHESDMMEQMNNKNNNSL